MNCFFISGRFLVQSLRLSRLFDAFSKRSPPAQLTALLTALGSPYHSRPNGKASQIRSTPRLSVLGLITGLLIEPLRDCPWPTLLLIKGTGAIAGTVFWWIIIMTGFPCSKEFGIPDLWSGSPSL
jgi:hypothetical protein